MSRPLSSPSSPVPASETAPPHTAPGRTFTVYAVGLFMLAAWVICRDLALNGLGVPTLQFLVVGGAAYLFSIFIILSGFPTPRGAHISLDRITQVGLTLAFGPVFSAIVNGLASFTYPILRPDGNRRMAWVRALHNSGMFALTVYLSGRLYVACNGPLPPADLDGRVLFAFAALVFAMQAFNGLFMRIRDKVRGVNVRTPIDWFSHRIEIPVAFVGLVTAIIYEKVSVTVFLVFLLLLIGVILIVKSLNKLTSALKQQVKHVITVNRIAKAISSEVKLPSLLGVVQEECISQWGALDFDLCLTDTHGLPRSYMHGANGSRLAEIESPQPSAQASIAQALAGKREVSTHHPDAGAAMCVPIAYQSEQLGALCVSSTRAAAFEKDDVRLFVAIGRQISSALKNVDLIRDLEERKASLEDKVAERVAEIERQKLALAEANAAQAKLLDSLRETSALLEQQTREDALTGLHNRRYLEEFLGREHERAMRHETALSVAMMDVDLFKSVNDTYSHQVGDAVLKALGKILPEQTRALDLVARYGGEEFFFCFPDTKLAQAVAVCERARLAVAGYDWASVAPGLAVTVSFGVAQSAHESIEQLMSRCDQKLYDAKHNGRNQVCS